MSLEDYDLECNDWPYPLAVALNSFFKVQIVTFINVFRKVYFVIAIIVIVSIYTQLMSGLQIVCQQKIIQISGIEFAIKPITKYVTWCKSRQYTYAMKNNAFK